MGVYGVRGDAYAALVNAFYLRNYIPLEWRNEKKVNYYKKNDKESKELRLNK